MTSLRTRVLLGAGLAAAIVLAISSIAIYVLARRALVEQFDDALMARARGLAMLVEQEGDRVEVDDLPTHTPPGEAFELRDASGRTLARSKRALAGRSVELAFSARAEEVAATAQPLLTMTFARETAELDAMTARIATILAGVGVAAIAIVLGVLAWITRAGLRPIDTLAADIANVPLGERVGEERPVEIVVIAKRLNELLARVDRAMARERELTAEVTHELRTPLAGLRATLELALDRERTPERYRDALAQCLAITTQTERMVESMLSLAKLDAGVVALQLEDVELDTLVRDALAQHTARITERGIAVSTDLAHVVVRSDRTKLATVLHNLVDNAASYTDERGTIAIRVADRTIEITNTGCTLADTQHVFERFWRGDAARTAGTHAGLGLAICKTLVALLGGTIEARVADGRFIASVALPATSKTNVDSMGSAA